MAWPKGKPYIMSQKQIDQMLAERRRKIRQQYPETIDLIGGRLDFSSLCHRPRGKGQKAFIEITCKKCGKWRFVQWNAVQQKLNNPKYTGLCNQCSNHRYGLDHPNWKGGSRKTVQGYIALTISPRHPMATMRNQRREIYEHRLIMALHLNRPLKRYEHVHHKDGNRTNNHLDNLELVTTQQNQSLKDMLSRIKYLENLLIQHDISF